jgi:hypothetical protein
MKTRRNQINMIKKNPTNNKHGYEFLDRLTKKKSAGNEKAYS